MLNLLSLLIGLVTFVMAIIAFTPLLGWANWIVIPIAAVGLALGAMSDKKAGRNLNLVVIGLGALRLVLGGGLFLRASGGQGVTPCTPFFIHDETIRAGCTNRGAGAQPLPSGGTLHPQPVQSAGSMSQGPSALPSGLRAAAVRTTGAPPAAGG